MAPLADDGSGVPFLTTKVAKVEWLKTCLSAVRTLPKVAEGTVEGLRVGLLPMYSFTELSLDSTNNDASLAEGMEVPSSLVLRRIDRHTMSLHGPRDDVLKQLSQRIINSCQHYVHCS